MAAPTGMHPGAGPLRIAIDTGRPPVGALGQAEFAVNQGLGEALARSLLAQNVIVVRVPAGLTPVQRARAAVGAQLLVSVNHEVMTDARREQAAAGQGYTIGLSGRQAQEVPVALSLQCARDVGQALAATGRKPAPRELSPLRPPLDLARGVQRQDDLPVLNTAPVPALRLQVALVANPAEARLAADPRWLHVQATAIAGGLLACVGRGQGQAPGSALLTSPLAWQGHPYAAPTWGQPGRQ